MVEKGREGGMKKWLFFYLISLNYYHYQILTIISIVLILLK